MLEDKPLGAEPDDVAPDGSLVRILLRLESGSMAHFELAGGETSVTVRMPNLDEIWYFLSGRGCVWRRLGDFERTCDVGPGMCLTIRKGTHFQFKAVGPEPLTAISVTMPPWPQEGGATEFVEGPWNATVEPGSP